MILYEKAGSVGALSGGLDGLFFHWHFSSKSFAVGFTPKIHHIQVLQEAADATSGCLEAAWALRRVGSAWKCETHLQLRLSGKDFIKGLCPTHERLWYCPNPVGIRRR